MNAYAELANYLREVGIDSYMQNPNLLVVSNNYPALPTSNCFWAALRDNVWYVGTWLPAVYRVPADANIGEICKRVFESSERAIYTVEKQIAARLHLSELSEVEMAQLGFT